MRRDDLELYDIIAFDGGYVAGGCRLDPTRFGGGCAEAVLMQSRDGRTWVETDLGPDAAERLVLTLAATPLGLLALGEAFVDEPPGSRAAWRSADGSSWEWFDIPAPKAVVFEQAAVLGNRTVLLGFDMTDDSFAVQTEVWSTDGTSWTSGSTPVSPKVEGHPGLVAAGDECVDVCEDGLPIQVFRSTDGLRWTKDAWNPALTDARLIDRGSWKGRAVLVGARSNASGTRASVWIDGEAGWQAVALPGGEGWYAETVLELGERVIVIARSEDDNTSRAWTSTDGRTWSRVALEGLGDSYVGAVASVDPTVAIVNYQSIWIAGS
jgi:hypothetical protein